MFLYVIDELSYDRFQKNYHNIYQVVSVTNFSGDQSQVPNTPVVLADVVKSANDDIVIARVFQRQAQLDPGGGKIFKEKDFVFADPAVLNIFTFDLITGSNKNPLADESSILISASLAIKLFGHANDALGKTVTVENKLPLIVSGVYNDWPPQSQFRYNIVSHFNNYLKLESEPVQQYLRTDWLFTAVTTFVLAKSERRQDLEKLIDGVRQKHADDRVRGGVKYILKPFRELHLYSDFRGSGSNNEIVYIYIFIMIGGLVLFMASVNFINLSIATGINRLKELSLRKVLGAGQRNIVIQYVLESFSYLIISLFLAAFLLIVSLPFMNDLFEKRITLNDFLNPYFISIGLLVYIFTGCFTGVVPAYSMVRINPVLGIKGYLSSNFKAVRLIRPLVIMQFVISSVLLLFMFIVDSQVTLLKERDLGFQKEHILNVPLFMENLNSIFGGVDGNLRGRMNAFENELLANSAIEAVTASSSLPGGGTILALVTSPKIKAEDNVFLSFISVDYDFTQTYNIPVVAGRTFTRDSGTDHLDAFIINQTARRALNFQSDESAVGEPLELVDKKGKVVGVVQDFNFQGLQEPVNPLALEVSASKFSVFSIRVNKKLSPAESVEVIESMWKKHFPERYFESSLLTDSFNENYRSQFKLAEMVRWFALLASFISIVGLFGLTGFTSSLYLKEISLRKILGASSFSVLTLLLARQVKIVLYIVILGFPMGYWISRQWLQVFAYRTDMTWSIFFLTYFLIAGFIVLSTIYHFVKSSRVNSLDVVRSE